MKSFIKKSPHWALCVAAVASAALYWGIWATDRYVSETNIVMQSSELNSTGFNVASLLSGTSGAGDLLLLRDHLLSADMMIKLDKTLNLRQHYSSQNIDYLSRLSSSDVPMEKFVSYMLKRVEVEYDDYASVMRIKVQAFNPDMAKQIAELLLANGEQHMNTMGQRLAAEQVSFIEMQVKNLAERLHQARQDLLNYQNQNGMVSPTGTVQSILAIVAQLEGQLSTAQARLKVATSFQSATSPEVVRLKSEIKALQQQIALELKKTASSSGGALNKISADYQSLELQANFAMELYSNALAALESTRVEAARKLKQVSVLQYPTKPEYSAEPRRLYNTVVFTLFALILTFITHLAIWVIRDHKD
ncbi:MAG: chain-length determining protein [Pararheinheimera sp.]|nr:chain-length determining protein [Rheinheimera sp.]